MPGGCVTNLHHGPACQIGTTAHILDFYHKAESLFAHTRPGRGRETRNKKLEKRLLSTGRLLLAWHLIPARRTSLFGGLATLRAPHLSGGPLLLVFASHFLLSCGMCPPYGPVFVLTWCPCVCGETASRQSQTPWQCKKFRLNHCNAWALHAGRQTGAQVQNTSLTHMPYLRKRGRVLSFDQKHLRTASHCENTFHTDVTRSQDAEAWNQNTNRRPMSNVLATGPP